MLDQILAFLIIPIIHLQGKRTGWKKSTRCAKSSHSNFHPQPEIQTHQRIQTHQQQNHPGLPPLSPPRVFQSHSPHFLGPVLPERTSLPACLTGQGRCGHSPPHASSCLHTLARLWLHCRSATGLKTRCLSLGTTASHPTWGKSAHRAFPLHFQDYQSSGPHSRNHHRTDSQGHAEGSPCHPPGRGLGS